MSDTTTLARLVPAAAVRPVTRVVRGMRASDGAGVTLYRSLGSPALPDLDPFLMLDEFYSEDPGDYLAGFPEHPHRGFETVTYMLAGRMRHSDNQGNSGLLGPGSVQWMTAGRGIVHSEMPEQENGLMWGFQLWINLPSRDKMTAPRYQDIPPERIPVLELPGGVRVKVIAGAVDDHRGPVAAPATDPVYLDVNLPAGARFVHELPEGHAAFAYVFEGAVGFGPDNTAGPVERGYLAVLGPGTAVVAAACGGPGRFLLLAGRPIGEPVAKYGPFVMNKEEELRQAVLDFQAGRF
jgi:redox-sensitive bicupin YhaK (pirin superfamily)